MLTLRCQCQRLQHNLESPDGNWYGERETRSCSYTSCQSVPKLLSPDSRKPYYFTKILAF